MYRDGLGVRRDLVEAYAWFTAAGENGVMDGLAYRSEIAKLMTNDADCRSEKTGRLARQEGD